MDTQHLTNTIMAMSLGQSGQKDPIEILKLVLIMWLTSYVKNILEYLVSFVNLKSKQIYHYFKHPGSERRYETIKELYLANKLIEEYHCDDVPNGLIYYIYKKNYKITQGIKSNSIKIENTIKNIYLPYDQEIELSKDIYFNIKVEISQRKIFKENIILETYNHHIIVTIYSKHHFSNYIDSFLEKCEKNYELNQKEYNLNYIRKLIPTYNDGKKNKNELTMELYAFKSTKTFNNSFFEQKESILNRLNTFIKQENEYKRLGIPYNLGFLFYGSAGTGKTSCIKSISHFLKKDILLINLSLIKNNSQFLYILNDNVKHSIFVFEEIDCSSNLLLDRSQVKTELNEKDIKDDVLSLGGILEILDGMIEHPGRICIFTTNYPDRLDKALLRPGRIDMIVEFKKMRKIDVKNMYKLWFNLDIPSKVYDKMKDYTYSQAEIGNLFQQHFNNPKSILNILK
jgi:SpoVK/Ycf46/Vps4 family AAA+-type ATPase